MGRAATATRPAKPPPLGKADARLGRIAPGATSFPMTVSDAPAVAGSLDPDIATMLARVARAGRPAFRTMPPAEARAAYARAAPVLDVARRPMARVDDLDVPMRDGATVHVRLVGNVADGSSPMLVYFHGGGFTIGSVSTHDALCRLLAAGSGCLVASVGYRLAPEHRFPTATEDARDAFDWLSAHAEALGVDRHRIAVGGDSAGGTLAAVTAIHARDRGTPCRLQLLLYPGTATEHDTAAIRGFGEGLLLDAKTIAWFFAQYAPEAWMRDDWRFAPLDGHGPDDRVIDLAGVAPACVVTAGFDPLCAEGRAYADRLARSGVPVRRLHYPGFVHGFAQMGGMIPAVRVALGDIVAALGDGLARRPVFESDPRPE